MKKRKATALSLAEPSPVSVEVEMGDGNARTLALRPFSLRDQQWLNEELAGRDLSEKVLQNNDVSDVLKVFVHQLQDADRAWLARQYGTTEAALADEMFSRIPADGNLDPHPVQALMSAVFLSHSNSFPEVLAGNVKKKLLPRACLRLMKWLFVFASGWAAALLTLSAY